MWYAGGYPERHRTSRVGEAYERLLVDRGAIVVGQRDDDLGIGYGTAGACIILVSSEDKAERMSVFKEALGFYDEVRRNRWFELVEGTYKIRAYACDGRLLRQTLGLAVEGKLMWSIMEGVD